MGQNMFNNTSKRFDFIDPTSIARVVSGLLPILITTFAHFANADEVIFGFAAGMEGTESNIGEDIAGMCTPRGNS